MKFKTSMVLVVGLVGAMQTSIIGLFAWRYLSVSLEDQIAQKALSVSRTIAAMPAVIEAVEQRNTPWLQNLTATLTKTNNARFIVIGDAAGIRLAHPNSERIGYSMTDDDSDDNSPALIFGKGYIAKAKGSLGFTVRGKAPIFNALGENIIGVVSVGYALDQVESTIARYNTVLFAVIALMILVSVVSAILIATRTKKAIFGLEPEQIASLFQERDATLQSIREGVIAINKQGLITTFNPKAIETLGLSSSTVLQGQRIQDVLPESGMMEVLKNGQPQYDQEVWIRGRALIVNRLPLQQGPLLTGVVSSFRPKDELDLVGKKLSRIQQYADSLRSQAHEYSNKLHTIAGLIQIGATDEALNVIGSETQGHQELIELLLKAVPDPVVAGCLLGKYSRAKELGLNLVIDPESQMADIPAELPREHLVSLLGNIIDNAMEASLITKSGTGEVRVSMTDLGNELIFEVEDDGPGIPEADIQQIFAKGYSSKPGENHGIGLHLVRSFVDSWGGNITVEPVSEAGTRFTLYLAKQPKNSFIGSSI
jgi:two-component system, CitB family, sensor kinase